MKVKRETKKISQFTHDEQLKIAACFDRQSKKVSRLGTAISKAKDELYKDLKFPGFDGYHALNFTWRAKYEKDSKLSKEFYKQNFTSKGNDNPHLNQEESHPNDIHIHIHR